MLPITLACLIWLPALVGLGSPVTIALRRSTGGIISSVALRAAIAGLLGMFAASVLISIANFFIPVYPLVSTSILLIGWFLFIHNRRYWNRLPTRAWRTFLLTVLTISLIDARGLAWYDTGLYHLQALRWMTTGPLPAGLVNLHSRLGFNCSWFAVAATFETPLVLGKSCFIANALVAILIALPAMDALLRARGKLLQPDRVVMILMLLPLGFFGVNAGLISSLAPDLIIMLLVPFTIALCVRSARLGPYALTLAFFAVTIKLSAVPLLLIALAMTAIGGRRGGRLPAVFSLIAGSVFVVRGIWLSGYPAFPWQLGRLSNLSWTAPAPLVLHTAREVEYWSKYKQIYETVNPGSPWMSQWIGRNAFTQPMVIAYALFFLGITLVLCRKRRLTPAARQGFFIIIGLVPAIACWFITAPQVRFGYGYIFSLAALPTAIGLGGIALPTISRQRHVLLVVLCAIGLLSAFRIDRHILKTSLLHWPAIPQSKMLPRQTLDGVTVFTPADDDRAWDAPLPTTPELDPQLRCDRDIHGRVRRFYINSSGQQ